MEALIIDWMDGTHLQYDSYDEAVSVYDKMLLDYKKNGCEIDLQLLQVKKEFNNIDK